jgi:SAM-dependent methyltransferase
LNDVPSQVFWDERDRYKLTPNRYIEVTSIGSIRKLFTNLYGRWKSRREWITYTDLGCGNCRGTRTFANFLEKDSGIPVKATGIDSSKKCSSQCEELEVNFLRVNLGSEPIPMKDCQVFTLFETIEHIFNTDFLLESIRKAISKDGILLVTTLNVVCWKNRILVPLGIQPLNTEVSTRKLNYGFRLKYLKKRVDFWKPAGHIRPFTLYSLCDILEDNGFSVISSYGLENWRPFKFLENMAKNLCTGILVAARPS